MPFIIIIDILGQDAWTARICAGPVIMFDVDDFDDVDVVAVAVEDVET